MKILTTIAFLIAVTQLYDQSEKIYNPSSDAAEQIENAVAQAQAENKNVLLLIGGNWCPWCRKFHKYINEDQQIDSLINANYIRTYINYSKENKNLETLKKLEFPQRFGFPVFVILNEKGERIHTQNSALLESGDGYDRKKVIGFLMDWRPAVLNIKNYKDYSD